MFSFKPGYCFSLDRVLTALGTEDVWRNAPDDCWEIVIAPLFDTPPQYVGTRRIDQADCAVFRSPPGLYWAQTVVVARDP